MHTPPISSGKVISGTSMRRAAERQRDRTMVIPTVTT